MFLITSPKNECTLASQLMEGADRYFACRGHFSSVLESEKYFRRQGCTPARLLPRGGLRVAMQYMYGDIRPEFAEYIRERIAANRVCVL